MDEVCIPIGGLAEAAPGWAALACGLILILFIAIMGTGHEFEASEGTIKLVTWFMVISISISGVLLLYFGLSQVLQ